MFLKAFNLTSSHCRAAVTKKPSKEIVRQYLLDDPALNGSAKLQIETSYFESDWINSYILAQEDELIDAFVCGDLEARSRILFERSLEHSERWRRKVDIARSLVRYAAIHVNVERNSANSRYPRSPRFRHALQFMSVCGVLLLITGASFLLQRGQIHVSDFGIHRLVAPPLLGVPQVHSESASPQSVPLTLPATKTLRLSVIPVFLTSNLVRGGVETSRVSLPSAASVLEFKMRRPPEPYVHYKTTLANPERGIVARQDGLKYQSDGNTKTVMFFVGSKRLRLGVYILHLEGKLQMGEWENVEDYTFEATNP